MNKTRKRIMLTTAEGQSIKYKKDFLVLRTYNVTPSFFKPEWVFSDDSVMTINWGDGSPLESHATTLSHTYTNLGIKTVKFNCPDWEKLTTLDLYNFPQYLSCIGNIPPLDFAPNLEYVDLSNNLFENLPNDGYPSSLKFFLAENSQIKGAIPDFNNYTNLEWLFFDNNLFTTCPSNFNGCIKLINLFADKNQITGILPDVRDCSLLEYYVFDDNLFTNYNPGCFATQKYLVTIDLKDNLLSTKAIDDILHDLVISLSIPGRVIIGPAPSYGVWLDGTGNHAPTSTGMADYDILVAAGWNVQINQPNLNLIVNTITSPETVGFFYSPLVTTSTIDWGDGSALQTVPVGSWVDIPHEYATSGSYNITATRANMSLELVIKSNHQGSHIVCLPGELNKLVSATWWLLGVVPGLQMNAGEISNLYKVEYIQLYLDGQMPGIIVETGEIKNLTRLKWLWVYGPGNFAMEAGEIENLTSLTSVRLESLPDINIRVGEIEKLTNLTDLQTVDMPNINIDYGELVGKNLSTIYIENCPNILIAGNDITSLINLTYLYLINTPSIIGSGDISHLVKLQELYLLNLTSVILGVNDLSPLTKLQSIVLEGSEISASPTTFVSSASTVSNMYFTDTPNVEVDSEEFTNKDGLTRIGLAGNVNLSLLAALPTATVSNLAILGLKNIFDFTNITSMPNLEVLQLGENPNVQIDTGEIRDLINLKTLLLSRDISNVISAGDISALPALEYISFNGVSDFDFPLDELADMPNICEIDWYGNESYPISPTKMDGLLEVIYENRMIFTGGAWEYLAVWLDDGTENVPTGIYQDVSVPTTGMEYAYKLVNDPDGEGFFKWEVDINPSTYYYPTPGRHYVLTVQNADSGQTGQL